MATCKTCPHSEEERLHIPGTKFREILINNEDVPKEFSRPEALQILKDYYQNKNQLFHFHNYYQQVNKLFRIDI